jgi:GNAT superfamily N-acetyltransferase
VPSVRELPLGETALAHAALIELRPAFPSQNEFVRRVDEIQRPEGYRLLGSFEDDGDDAAGVAGFRTGHNLVWGYFIYVDDLVTRAAFRGRGHADALMSWLFKEAKELGCDQLHLDSATHRHDAHRFYLKHRLNISSFHFSAENIAGPAHASG